MFDETFDAREWIKEHGIPQHGRSFSLRFDSSYLGSSVQIPSCASWSFPELGVGQGREGQHQGYRGTLGNFLEKARRDVEMNMGMYGEAAKPAFEAVLQRIDRLLHSELSDNETVTLSVHDPSGLCSIPQELIVCVKEDATFERTSADKLMLIPKEFTVGKRLSRIEDIAKMVQRAKSIVALTGAGISVESGITPFRNPSDNDDKGTLWGKFDAGKMTVQNFNSSPEITRAWWDMKRSLVQEVHDAVPNPAHLFFSMLEQQGKLRAVVTQNIDSLHLKSGVSPDKVIELHGHMRGLVCSDNRTELNPIPYRDGKCTFCISADNIDALNAVYKDMTGTVPTCPVCGCPLRTETVMFGQPMPMPAVDAACKAIEEADLLFVIGSTLIVAPANELPCLALRNQAPLVMINFDSTQYDVFAAGLVRQKAGEFLSNVAEVMKQLPQAAEGEELSGATQKDFESPEIMKQLRVAKEGSRYGKEIATNAKACGMSMFCTAIAEPQGDFDLLEKSLSAMNLECPEIGKMVFSDGTEQLAVVTYVPDGHGSAVNAETWSQAVAQEIGGTISEVTSTSARLVIRAGPDAYPIKLKEQGITAANRFLKDTGLFPEDDDDDDIVYGDDDFPS